MDEFAWNSGRIFLSRLDDVLASDVLNMPNIACQAAGKGKCGATCVSLSRPGSVLTVHTCSWNGEAGPLGTAYHINHHNFLLSESLSSGQFRALYAINRLDV